MDRIVLVHGKKRPDREHASCLSFQDSCGYFERTACHEVAHGRNGRGMAAGFLLNLPFRRDVEDGIRERIRQTWP